MCSCCVLCKNGLWLQTGVNLCDTAKNLWVLTENPMDPEETKRADGTASEYHLNHCHMENNQSLTHPESTQRLPISTKSERENIFLKHNGKRLFLSMFFYTPPPLFSTSVPIVISCDIMSKAWTVMQLIVTIAVTSWLLCKTFLKKELWLVIKKSVKY